MSVDLSPKAGKKLFEGDGGSYTTWSGVDQPIIADAKVGGGVLALKPLGFALPHYADSPKVGLVLEGRAIVGVLLPGDHKEKVLLLEKGDVIILPLGNLTWWYNDEDSNFAIMFLGDTSVAVHPGDFSYFFLAGGLGIFNGFSMDTLTRVWGIREEEAKKLFKSQLGVLVIKLEQKLHGLEPHKADAKGIVVNFEHSSCQIDVNKGKHDALMTGTNVPMLKEFRFSANFTKLNPNALRSPGFYPDAAIQVIYVVKGSGRVEIAGTDGKNILDADVKEGYLFVVPQFLPASMTAGDEGMEWFSIITSPKPLFTQLTGKTSLLKAIAPQILETSLNVTQDLVKLLI